LSLERKKKGGTSSCLCKISSTTLWRSRMWSLAVHRTV
jgi:hypothetical protein